MSRLPENDKILLVSKWRELEQAGQGSAHFLHMWAKSSGRAMLSRVPHWKTLNNLIAKAKIHSSTEEAVKDAPRDTTKRGGKRATISPKARAVILKKAKSQNRTRRARRAVSLAKETHAGRKVSEASVRRVLKAGGLIFRKSQARINLKPHHISCRLRWAQIWAKKSAEFWRKFMFSDEKIFRMRAPRHRQNDGLWVDVVQPSHEDEKELSHISDRYSGQVNVWGGISFYGKSELCLFDVTLTEDYYKKTIINKYVMPFFDSHPNVEIFQQDGDPKHTAHGTMAHLDKKLGVGRWTRPPPPPCKKKNKDGEPVRVPKTSKKGTTKLYQVDSVKCNCPIPLEYIHMAKSPDCNPQEHVWTEMQRWLADRSPPQNMEGFRQLLQDAWRAVSLEYIRTLFDSMPKRFASVVKAKGKSTRY